MYGEAYGLSEDCRNRGLVEITTVLCYHHMTPHVTSIAHVLKSTNATTNAQVLSVVCTVLSSLSRRDNLPPIIFCTVSAMAYQGRVVYSCILVVCEYSSNPPRTVVFYIYFIACNIYICSPYTVWIYIINFTR